MLDTSEEGQCQLRKYNNITILQQMATFVTVGWFAGHMWKINNNWYT